MVLKPLLSTLLIVLLSCCQFFLAEPAQAVSDFWQRSLPFPVKPQRIVSLSPATTEILYAVGAGAQVVGVTSTCNYPPQVLQKPRLGMFGTVPMEALLKLRPDLIVVTTDMQKVLAPLQRLPIPVLALDSRSLVRLWQNVETVANLTGHRAQGRLLSMQMQSQFKALRARIPARHQVPGVFYLVWDQPLIAAGSASFIGDVLRLSGARNLVPDATQPFPHVSLEYLLKSDPEVLILPESLASRIQLNRSPFNRLQAVQGHRVLRLPDDLISRPAPRILQAMSQIIDFLHRKG